MYSYVNKILTNKARCRLRYANFHIYKILSYVNIYLHNYEGTFCCVPMHECLCVHMCV